MYDNNNSRFIFGDGDGQRMHMPGVAVDLVAHEFTHGVTHYESNLTYQDESGAINEALSDIFGVAAEIWKDSGGSAAGNPDAFQIDDESYTMGEDITPEGGEPSSITRVLNDPSRFTDNYPDTYPEYKKRLYINNREICENDHGCVHFNMSILSLAFYLLAEGGQHPQAETEVQVDGIGIDKALEIYYHAATNSFDSSTDHKHARRLIANSAETLYGECSKEWHSVNRSFDAIEVNEDWSPCDCDTEDSEGCSAPQPKEEEGEGEKQEEDQRPAPHSEDQGAKEIFEIAKSIMGMGQGALKLGEQMLGGGTAAAEMMLDAMAQFSQLFGGGNSIFGKLMTGAVQASRAGIEIMRDVVQMIARMGEMMGRVGEMMSRMIDMIVRMEEASRLLLRSMEALERIQNAEKERVLSFLPDLSTPLLLSPSPGQEVRCEQAPELEFSNKTQPHRIWLASSPLMRDGLSAEIEEQTELNSSFQELCTALEGDTLYLAVQFLSVDGRWSSLSNVVRLSLKEDSNSKQSLCDETQLQGCDEPRCLEAGLEWCEGLCQVEPCAPNVECSLEQPELCQDELHCLEVELNWCGESCQVESCASSEPELFEEDLALAAEAHSSSRYSASFLPSRLNDADLDTGWASGRLYGPLQEEWVMLELDGHYDLDEIIIRWGENAFARNFAIFANREGNWAQVYEGFKSSSGATRVQTHSVSTNRVLIRMRNGFNMNYFEIKEISIF